MIGLRQVETLEVRLDHPRVEVLARVDEHHLVPRAERGQEGSRLHELRAGARDDGDTHRPPDPPYAFALRGMGV